MGCARLEEQLPWLEQTPLFTGGDVGLRDIETLRASGAFVSGRTTTLPRLVWTTATARSGFVVFMRGVQAETSEGVLELQPPESLLVELDALFAGRHS